MPPGSPPPPQPRPKPQYSRFTALVLSFFSTSLYRDVARRWRGIGLLYLLLLMFVTWLPVVIRWHLQMRAWSDGGAAQRQLAEFPTITIRNGVVSIAEEEPYVWRDVESGEPILVVDTSGAFDLPEAKTARMLLSRSTLEARNNPTETRVYDLSQVEYFYIDRQKALGWVQRATNWSWAVALPGGLALSVVWGLVRMLLYGLIGLLFASIFRARLDYAALMRLSAVAMTPGMVIDALSWIFNVGWIPCCGWNALIGMVTLAYLAIAVKANAEPAMPPGIGGTVPGYGSPLGAGGYPYPPPPPPAPPYPPTANPPYPPR